MQRLALRIASLIVGLFFCSAARADAGGPLLLIVNLYVFSLGQAWILVAEFVYLLMRMPAGSKRLPKLVFMLNLWSTLGGALLIPLAWSICFLGFSAMARQNQSTSDVLAYLGNWAMPGSSEFSWLLVPSTVVLFAVTFVGTVIIEYKLMNRWRDKYGLPDQRTLRRWSIEMNLISYAGLVVFFAGGLLVSRL